MIKNEETYCVVPHKIVREIGAYEAIVFGTIYTLLRKTNGVGEVKNETLMELCGITNKMSLSRYIRKLIESGYVEKREGKGRGNISIYYVTEKGNNLLPIKTKKGNKNDIEKVTKMSEKGNNLLPLYTINEDINKEINKEEDGNMREAQFPSTTTTFFNNSEKENLMEHFEEFWSMYPYAKEFATEKENCERVWYSMPKEWKDRLLAQLKQGKLWRNKKEPDNPYWYLKDYNGAVVNFDLPIIRQGTQEFINWLNKAERNNENVCLFLDKPGTNQQEVVYCLEKDKKECEDGGLVFLRYR